MRSYSVARTQHGPLYKYATASRPKAIEIGLELLVRSTIVRDPFASLGLIPSGPLDTPGESHNALPAPGREADPLMHNGIRSGRSPLFPLALNAGVLGKFMLYHAQPHEFGPDELDLAGHRQSHCLGNGASEPSLRAIKVRAVYRRYSTIRKR